MYQNHPAWKNYVSLRGYEERRIRKLNNLAERARQYAWLDKWAAETEETLKMLIDQQESQIPDNFEDLLYD